MQYIIQLDPKQIQNNITNPDPHNINAGVTIVDFFTKTMGLASILPVLDKHVKNYVEKQCGLEYIKNFRIIEVSSLAQVCEPLLCGLIAYRLDSMPSRVYLYKKEMVEVQATLFFKAYASTIFHKDPVMIFEFLDKTTTDLPEAVENEKAITRLPIDSESKKVLFPSDHVQIRNAMLKELLASTKFIIAKNKINNENNQTDD